MARPAVAVVVMGVTGCGKTTVGTLLAQRLGVPYLEADDFHPAANVAKMQAGIPLTDEDRRPWLAAIGRRLAAEGDADPGCRPVVSCSALKRQYRDLLRQAEPTTWFLHLAIDEATAAERVAARRDHFMPVSLVVSQFADLEPLDSSEPGCTVAGPTARWAPIIGESARIRGSPRVPPSRAIGRGLGDGPGWRPRWRPGWRWPAVIYRRRDE